MSEVCSTRLNCLWYPQALSSSSAFRRTASPLACRTTRFSCTWYWLFVPNNRIVLPDNSDDNSIRNVVGHIACWERKVSWEITAVFFTICAHFRISVKKIFESVPGSQDLLCCLTVPRVHQPYPRNVPVWGFPLSRLQNRQFETPAFGTAVTSAFCPTHFLSHFWDMVGTGDTYQSLAWRWETWNQPSILWSASTTWRESPLFSISNARYKKGIQCISREKLLCSMELRCIEERTVGHLSTEGVKSPGVSDEIQANNRTLAPTFSLIESQSCEANSSLSDRNTLYLLHASLAQLTSRPRSSKVEKSGDSMLKCSQSWKQFLRQWLQHSSQGLLVASTANSFVDRYVNSTIERYKLWIHNSKTLLFMPSWYEAKIR